MSLGEILKKIVQEPLLHARWLNTLSYLENCGARLIAACEHPTMVTQEVLKHAAEEFRHAYFFKAQISKVSSQALSGYLVNEIFGGYLARHYLYRLNIQISRYLKYQKNLNRDELKEYAYLLVTYAIEVRAEVIYPLYQSILSQYQSPISIVGIIRDEEWHLKEIMSDLQGTKAMDWLEEVCQIEEILFQRFQNQVKKDILQAACLLPA